MMLRRTIAAIMLSLLVTLTAAVPVAAAPVPSLDGTWLVRGSGEGPAMALVNFGGAGTVTAVVPGEALVLPNGRAWLVASPGQGTWRSRGFPDGEMTVAFLIDGAGREVASVLRFGVRITLAQTGQQWSGAAWMEALDGSGRASAARVEVGTLTATRVLYGRQ
jgi:hypothetical protein